MHHQQYQYMGQPNPQMGMGMPNQSQQMMNQPRMTQQMYQMNQQQMMNAGYGMPQGQMQMQPMHMQSQQPVMQQQMHMQQQNQRPYFNATQWPQGQSVPGSMPGGNWQMNQGFGQQQVRAPPPYTAQMAYNYQVKQTVQNQAPVPAPRNPAPVNDPKRQQITATQRRLAQVGMQGNKSVDADSMIQAMFGASKPSQKPKQPSNDAEDDFGDFMGGAVEESLKEEVGKVEEVPQVEEKPPAPPQEEKPDLTSMMMECSDLSRPAKAKTFQKPSVKQIQPQHSVTSSFKQSEKARQWSMVETDTLSSLFTIEPEPKPEDASLDDVNTSESLPNQPSSQDQNTQPSTDQSVADPAIQTQLPKPAATEIQQPQTVPSDHLSHIPKLYTNDNLMPPVYRMVLEATYTNGIIDTGRVYPILVRSNLSKEALGYIWSLANKHTPGTLIKEELYLVLALVALAQNNVQFNNTDILHTIPTPPVPNLGQGDLPAQPVVVGVARNDGPVVAPSSVENHVEKTLDDSDDFNDFEQAPMDSRNRSDTNDSFGDFVSTPTNLNSDETTPVAENSRSPFPSQTDSDARVTDLAPPLHNALKLHGKVQDLHFEFDPCRGSDSSSMSSYAFDNVSRDSDMTKSDDFDDFHGADSYSSESSLGGVPNVLPDLQKSDHTPAPPIDKFSAFRGLNAMGSGKDLNDDDEFSSFQEAKEVKPAIATISDLKNLVSNPDLYKKPAPATTKPDDKFDTFKSMEPPAPDQNDDWSTNNDDDSDWANFSSAPPTEQAADSNDRYSAFSSFTPKSNDFPPFPSDGPPPLPDDDDDFTNFAAAPGFDNPPKPRKPVKIGAGANSILRAQHARPHRDITYGAMQDEPPDFYDDDDDFGHDAFADSFGSQHQTGGEISSLHSRDWLDHDGEHVEPHCPLPEPHNDPTDPTSLPSPVGDFPQFDPPSLTSPINDFAQFPPSKSDHSLDSLTNKFARFKEDSQSIASLELPKPEPDARSHGDNQSLSSTGSGESPKMPDEQSVRSLEFKATSPVEESFGEFNSAEIDPACDDSNWIQQPKDAKEFLNSDLVLGDRYTVAMENSEEKYSHEWQRCLTSSLDLINGANVLFNEISNAAVCNEVTNSEKGSEYLSNLVEVYRVICRIKVSITSTAASDQSLASLLRDIEIGWNNLQVFISNSTLDLDAKSLDFRQGIVSSDEEDANDKVCGVCLIGVENVNSHKLFYAGRHYHASCANLWLNNVDSTLPMLRLPELI